MNYEADLDSQTQSFCQAWDLASPPAVLQEKCPRRFHNQPHNLIHDPDSDDVLVGSPDRTYIQITILFHSFNCRK